MSVAAFQVWLVTTIGGRSAIAMMMRSAWAWPIAESLHFLGLCLLMAGPAMLLWASRPVATVDRDTEMDNREAQRFQAAPLPNATLRPGPIDRTATQSPGGLAERRSRYEIYRDERQQIEL